MQQQNNRRPLFTLRASIRAALAEAGDNGATLEDLEAATRADRREIQRALGALGEMGEKFAAPITSKLWRHFATEAQRDAWVAGGTRKCAMSRHACQMDKPKMGAKVPHRPTPTAKQKATFSPPKPPEQTKPKGEAIKTEKTVETIDTTKRANNRLEAAPPLPPDPRYPSFSSMRPGVNPDTGKAWEARA